MSRTYHHSRRHGRDHRWANRPDRCGYGGSRDASESPNWSAICMISVLAVIMTGILPAWSSRATSILLRRSFRIPEPGGLTNITGNLQRGNEGSFPRSVSVWIFRPVWTCAAAFSLVRDFVSSLKYPNLT